MRNVLLLALLLLPGQVMAQGASFRLTFDAANMALNKRDGYATLAPPCHRQAHDGAPPAPTQGQGLWGIKAIADLDKRSYLVLRDLMAGAGLAALARSGRSSHPERRPYRPPTSISAVAV